MQGVARTQHTHAPHGLLTLWASTYPQVDAFFAVQVKALWSFDDAALWCHTHRDSEPAHNAQRTRNKRERTETALAYGSALLRKASSVNVSLEPQLLKSGCATENMRHRSITPRRTLKKTNRYCRANAARHVRHPLCPGKRTRTRGVAPRTLSF